MLSFDPNAGSDPSTAISVTSLVKSFVNFHKNCNTLLLTHWFFLVSEVFGVDNQSELYLTSRPYVDVHAGDPKMDPKGVCFARFICDLVSDIAMQTTAREWASNFDYSDQELHFYRSRESLVRQLFRYVPRRERYPGGNQAR